MKNGYAFNKKIGADGLRLIRKQLFDQYDFHITAVEESPSPVLTELDTNFGIDWIIKGCGRGYTVAARMQIIKAGYEPYNTFTIRYKLPSNHQTEWHKRVDAYTNKSLRPDLTFQAYRAEDDRLLSYGIIRTDDLYEFAIRNESSLMQQRGPDAVFLVVPWERLESRLLQFSSGCQFQYKMNQTPIWIN